MVQYAKGPNNQTISERLALYKVRLPYSDSIPRLEQLDWDFTKAKTGYLTHTLHPYPAKFIPQIPNRLIQELSAYGETILDPFCGSGTTLVEARRLGRHAVGIDANPLACLMSQVKASSLSEANSKTLYQLAEEIEQLAQRTFIGRLPLFPDLPIFPTVTKSYRFKGVEDWFDEHVIDELSFIKERCLAIESISARQLALVAFSSIIVTVSRQDSDTRYVRREKNIQSGDTLQQFSRALAQAIKSALELSQEIDTTFTTKTYQVSVLDPPQIGPVDLVICSPPYPNAFSYHLYHRTRDMDQPTFKRQEIGSHRKYSRKGPKAATEETFRAELHTILSWLRCQLRPNRHACFVIGDSTLKGKTIKNDELLIDVAHKTGFQVEANIKRHLQATKKYFNPKIGKIKDEHIVILRNKEGEYDRQG